MRVEVRQQWSSMESLRWLRDIFPIMVRNVRTHISSPNLLVSHRSSPRTPTDLSQSGRVLNGSKEMPQRWGFQRL